MANVIPVIRHLPYKRLVLAVNTRYKCSLETLNTEKAANNKFQFVGCRVVSDKNAVTFALEAVTKDFALNAK